MKAHQLQCHETSSAFPWERSHESVNSDVRQWIWFCSLIGQTNDLDHLWFILKGSSSEENLGTDSPAVFLHLQLLCRLRTKFVIAFLFYFCQLSESSSSATLLWLTADSSCLTASCSAFRSICSVLQSVLHSLTWQCGSSAQVAERRRQRSVAGHHPESFQLQPQPGAADLPHGDGVHEEEISGRTDRKHRSCLTNCCWHNLLCSIKSIFHLCKNKTVEFTVTAAVCHHSCELNRFIFINKLLTDIHILL